MSEERKAAAVFGALVADAAALGLHWNYDPARVKEVADANGGGAFVPLDAAHYEGISSSFKHALRCDGMQSQYGEVLRLWHTARRLSSSLEQVDRIKVILIAPRVAFWKIQRQRQR